MLEKVNKLPHTPGVYKFLNARGLVIYVGKAKSLRNRVGQYFQKGIKDGKTHQLVENVADVEFVEVFSELEALVLEAELIKHFRPKYNINLKDDKSYLYIVIRKDTSFSKILTARKNDLVKSDTVFGPFPNARSAKYLVRSLRRIFPFRDCSDSKFENHKNKRSPCLYGHIDLCPAPCTGRISEKDYKLNTKRIRQFLGGGQKKIVRDMQREMIGYSRKAEYEDAASVKKALMKFEYVLQSFRAPSEFIENPYLVEDIYTAAMQELLHVLPVLKYLPRRIECFDVANISGKDAAVSMVAAINGRLEKSEYKKFRIKLGNKPNDTFMLKEALTRRFLHQVREDLVSWGVPDLVVVDGGKGQVSTARQVLDALALDIPVIGLTKREETIVYLDEQESTLFRELKLDKSSEALKLLQRLRDESHRFARAYHHYLRARKVLQ